MMVSPSQPSAELWCPVRQTLLTDAHHDRAVMGHGGQAPLSHGTWMTCVTPVASAARPQPGALAFHHWTAIATRPGQPDVRRRALTVEARLVAQVEPRLRAGVRLEGRHRRWDPTGEQTACVEGLPQRLVMAAEGTRPRVAPESRRWLGAFHRPLDLGQEGEDRAGSRRIPRGHLVRQANARGGVRHQARRATKRRGAMTRAVEHGSDGAIVGMDALTVTALCAVGEPCGWLADGRMAAHGGVAHLGDARARGVAEPCRLVKELLGLLPTHGARLAQRKERLCRWAHQVHEDGPVPTALATTAAQDVCQRLLEARGVVRELRRPAVAPRCHAGQQRERFFGA